MNIFRRENFYRGSECLYEPSRLSLGQYNPRRCKLLSNLPPGRKPSLSIQNHAIIAQCFLRWSIRPDRKKRISPECSEARRMSNIRRSISQRTVRCLALYISETSGYRREQLPLVFQLLWWWVTSSHLSLTSSSLFVMRCSITYPLPISLVMKLWRGFGFL